MASKGAIPTPSDRTLFLIGGLPKSGTSALAGALYHCGLPMDINTRAGHRPLMTPATADVKTDGKYHMYESASVMVLNEQLLRGVVAGFEHQSSRVAPGVGSMMNPPHPDCVYNDIRNAGLVSVLLSMIPGFPFGIKDPRFAVLFGVWKRIFGITNPDIVLVPIFSVRPPLDAAAALARRSWMPSMEAALELWLRYNTDVLRWHELFDAPIVVFDSSEGYLGQIRTLTEMMTLEYDGDALSEFYQPTAPPAVDKVHLHRHPMRASIEDTYDKLLRGQIGARPGWRWSMRVG
jgi:hypothetical protein